MSSIGQRQTETYIKITSITARPYPNTNVSIKFENETTKEGIVIRDEEALSGAQNIMVRYADGTTQKFTNADGETISIKIGHVKDHYR
jgi:hypothetical protein